MNKMSRESQEQKGRNGGDNPRPKPHRLKMLDMRIWPPEKAIDPAQLAEFRRKAQECRDEASRASEEKQRDDWLHMAERWEKLATPQPIN